jgi:hypothetical protein
LPDADILLRAGGLAFGFGFGFPKRFSVLA